MSIERLAFMCVTLAVASALAVGCGSEEAPGGAVFFDGEATADAATVGDCKYTGCDPGEECIDGTCLAVDCSENVTCTDAGKMCDTFAKACYPTNGSCTSDNECPVFGLAKTSVRNRCVEGFCRSGVVEPAAIAGLEAMLAEPLKVLRPTPGELFAGQDDVIFSWVPSSGAHIVMVLDRLPTKASRLLEAAVWGMTIAKGGKGEASVALGKGITDGSWLPESTPLPTNKRLYFFAQSLDKVTLVATSKPIVFRVGGAWPKHGVPCPAGLEDGDLCSHPVEPLMCWQGSCRRICTSHGDCKGVGHLCGPLRKAARLCVKEKAG